MGESISAGLSSGIPVLFQSDQIGRILAQWVSVYFG
jgi:Cft2 family RNA processing exonuclease